MIDDREAFSADDRLNVCVPFWELPRLPEAAWTPLLTDVDLVLAPTLHIKAASRPRALTRA